MLNKKGTSIIELIVSIALLSIILTFMLKLLVDLNNIRTNTSFAKDNQIIRSEIIRTVENDFKNKRLLSLIPSLQGEFLALTFTFSEGAPAVLKVSPNQLIYNKTDGNIRKWTMENCKLYVEKIFFNQLVSSSSDSYGFLFNIQVHTTNKENNETRNNPLDDIQISYFSNEVKPDSLTIHDCYSIKGACNY